MPSMISRESLDELQERAVEQCIDILMGVADAMIGSDDLVWGDDVLRRPERIAKWVADERDGVFVHLQAIAPEQYLKRRRQFIKDVQDAGIGSI